MSTERQFQKAYLSALRAAAKEERRKSGGARLTEDQRISARFAAEQRAEERMISEHERVTKSLIKGKPWGYVIAQDKFMSGWGHGKGRSLYGIAVTSYKQAQIVAENMENRSDMTRIRIVHRLPSLKRGEHLHVVDHKDARRFFEIGGFKPEVNKRGRPTRRNRQYEASRSMNRAFREGYQAGISGKPRTLTGDYFVTHHPDEFFEGYDLGASAR